MVELNGQLVDDFLARRLHAREQPPHHRVEPERRANCFLEKHPRPVAAAHVPELVRQHGALNPFRHLGKTCRQQHRWLDDAERHWLSETINVADFSARLYECGDLVITGTCGGQLASAPQALKTRDAHDQPRQPEDDTGGKDECDVGGPVHTHVPDYAREHRRAANRAVDPETNRRRGHDDVDGL